jgi:hypothetical protein
MLEGLALGSDLLAVEPTGRLARDAKSTKPPTFLSRPATHYPPNPIRERIGSSTERCSARLKVLTGERH